MCIKSMRMIIPHNAVLTAGVNAVCAPPSRPGPSEGLRTHWGEGKGGGHSGSRCAINTWHTSTVGIYWQTDSLTAVLEN